MKLQILLTTILSTCFLAVSGCSQPIEVATVDFCQVGEEIGYPFRYTQAELDARRPFTKNLRKEFTTNELHKAECPSVVE